MPDNRYWQQQRRLHASAISTWLSTTQSPLYDPSSNRVPVARRVPPPPYSLDAIQPSPPVSNVRAIDQDNGVGSTAEALLSVREYRMLNRLRNGDIDGWIADLFLARNNSPGGNRNIIINARAPSVAYPEPWLVLGNGPGYFVMSTAGLVSSGLSANAIMLWLRHLGILSPSIQNINEAQRQLLVHALSSAADPSRIQSLLLPNEASSLLSTIPLDNIVSREHIQWYENLSTVEDTIFLVPSPDNAPSNAPPHYDFTEDVANFDDELEDEDEDN